MKYIFLYLLLANPVFLSARGGGGCFAGGTSILTPSGGIAVEKIKEGDRVVSEKDGVLKTSVVRSVYRVEAGEFVELKACGKTVKVTPSHPFRIAPGVFKKAGFLKTGDIVYVGEKDKPVKCRVEYNYLKKGEAGAYNLLVYPGGEYYANGFLVHNKGCFLPDTFILKADGEKTKISKIKNGDKLLSFDEKGAIIKTTVREIIKLEAEEYFEIKTAEITVDATAEHPFYAGDGVFKTASALSPGEKIYVYNGRGLSAAPIVSIKKIKAATVIYNLKTDTPNTFFANFIAVHNKGGGCFPAGVKISAPGGDKAVETLKKGDLVYAFDGGNISPVKIREVHLKTDSVLKILTDKGLLKTTAEHPLLGEKGFIKARELKPGDKIAFYRSSLSWGVIEKKILSEKEETVYNLSVEAPNTFIADGFVAHNKGGYGGYHSYRSGGRSDSDSHFLFILAFLVIAYILSSAKKNYDGELDYVFSREDIEKKAIKTEKLSAFIAKQDPDYDPDLIKNAAKKAFLNMQISWENRIYEPMRPLLMPHLFAQHETQLEIMKQNHEINVIEDVSISDMDLVYIRYGNNPENRFVTVLITANARDYYIDDRDNSFLRGDNSSQTFQEFWTFKLEEGGWLLDKIDQTAESGVLSKEDFVETFTDDTLSNIYGAPVGSKAPAGPALPAVVADKGVRVERMMNFLRESDKMWEPGKMEIDVTLSFMGIYGAWDKGDPEALPADALFPGMGESVKKLIIEKKAEGLVFEFKNLCVRKVDIVLVNHAPDPKDDEFVARISAHALKKFTRSGQVIYEDSFVSPFCEYWTFGKLDGKWKLKEILPRAEGERSVSDPNLDADSSPMQLEWYYTRKRPY